MENVEIKAFDMQKEVRMNKIKKEKKKKNTFFHIREIILCEHFGDIGFTDCVIGMKEKVREKKKQIKENGKSHL